MNQNGTRETEAAEPQVIGHEDGVFEPAENQNQMVEIPPFITQLLGTRDIQIHVLEGQVNQLQTELAEKEAVIQSLKGGQKEPESSK